MSCGQGREARLTDFTFSLRHSRNESPGYELLVARLTNLTLCLARLREREDNLSVNEKQDGNHQQLP